MLPRTGLDDVKNRKIYRDSNSDPSAVQPTTLFRFRSVKLIKGELDMSVTVTQTKVQTLSFLRQR
jgi:hypothetical protein